MFKSLRSYSLAAGGSGTAVFGPCQVGDIFESFLIQPLTTTTGTLVDFGMSRIQTPAYPSGIESACVNGLFSAFLSLANQASIFPIWFRITAELRYPVLRIDNSAGMGAISGWIGINVRPAFGGFARSARRGGM